MNRTAGVGSRWRCLGAIIAVVAGILALTVASAGLSQEPGTSVRAVVPGVAKDSGTFVPGEPTPTLGATLTPTGTGQTPTVTPSSSSTPATPTPSDTPSATNTPTPTPTQAPYSYVALGDSLATGLFASHGYVDFYREYIESDTGHPVALRNFGVNGWKSGELLNAVRTDQAMRTALAGADVITLNIGGNDLRQARSAYKDGTCGGADNQDCLRATQTRVVEDWGEIVSEVVALSGGDAIMRTMDIYNPYVGADQADGSFAVFTGYLDDVNQQMRLTAEGAGIRVAAVHAAFNGRDGDEEADEYIAFDGLHPNDKGHGVIADLLRRFGYAPLYP